MVTSIKHQKPKKTNIKQNDLTVIKNDLLLVKNDVQTLAKNELGGIKNDLQALKREILNSKFITGFDIPKRVSVKIILYF